MPVVSPSRYSTSSSTSLSNSLSSGSYRSTLSSSSSLDRPYYSSASGSYITPRGSLRSAFADRASDSASASEYRAHAHARYAYDSDGVRERKASYSSDYARYVRAPSVSASDSDSGISSGSRYAGRSGADKSGSRSRDASVARAEPPPRSLLALSTADFYSKYSPSNYVPPAQRLSTAVTGPNGDCDRDRERPKTLPGDAARLPLPRRARAEDERLQPGRARRPRPPDLRRDSTDDNGNDLQLSVAEIRRKFDPKMTVTRLPSREGLRETALSSDDIYGRARDPPGPAREPGLDKYANGTTGSLRWEFLSPSPSPDPDCGAAPDRGYTIKRATDPGSDVSTVYIAGKMSADRIPIDAVKNQLNANNEMGKILEKSTAVCVGNGDVGKYDRGDSARNVLSIEIGSEARGDEDAPPGKPPANHTSDFASYIQVSAPATPSPLVRNGSPVRGDAGSASPGDPSAESPGVPSGAATRALSAGDCKGSKLRYIDSEPDSETDSRLLVDYNGKDDNHYDEEGFENKTFEHENGHLLRKTADETDRSPRSKIKQNGLAKLSNGILDKEDEENEFNMNERSSREDSAMPETPQAKRKNLDINGEPSFQQYRHESSPVKGSSPSPASLSSRRRSSDSRPQPQEALSKTSGLNGLRNIGNTCFMNSVVQCLSNTRPLMEYCGNTEAFSPDINTTLSCMKGALIKAFSMVIAELWKAGEIDGVVNTTSLKAQIQRFAPRFMGYSQQDAQEFLRYLLEGLHEDVNRVTIKPKPILTEIDDNLSDSQKAQESWQRYLRLEDSRVGDIFIGQLKSSLRCSHCSHTSVTFDPFWDLSLSIPSRTGQLKLTQCLQHFTREEELDGDEKPTCSKCQVRRKCLKWFTVQKFPRVLVIHLKRFSPTERFRGKLNLLVEFPLTGLDMSPYAATARQATYNLYAVSNHSGTTYSGHYTAYCKHPYNGEWHEYNDSRVSPISSKNVVSSEAYVLFYELVGGSAPS